MNISTPDIELVDGLRRGDIEAFDSIYEKYASKLYGFGLHYLKSPEDAEELVQSVFLKIWENCRNIKKEHSFKAYLFTIAYNDICKVFRNRIYWKKFSENFLAENLILYDTSLIEEEISIQQVLERIRVIIGDLPEKQRSAFVKSKIEGKSAREIADDLNLSPGTVDNYVSDVLKYIRSHIHEGDIALLLFFSIFLT